MGPYPLAGGRRDLKFVYRIEALNYEDEKVNATQIYHAYKSEAWLSGICDKACPSNCTTPNEGAVVTWSYIQKSVNPIGEDHPIFDTSLRLVCKGNLSDINI